MSDSDQSAPTQRSAVARWWRVQPRAAKVVAPVLFAGGLGYFAYRHYVEHVDMTEPLLFVVGYAALWGFIFGLSAALTPLFALFGRSMDRTGLRKPIQKAASLVVAGAKAGLALVGICIAIFLAWLFFDGVREAVEQMSTSTAIIVGAAIIAFAISANRK